MLVTQGEGSAIPTEPHYTPSSQEQHSSHHDTSSSSYPTTTNEPIPQTPIVTPTETPTLRQYSRRATRISQSKALSPAADEPASLLRDDSQGEAFLTISSLDVGQDMENINKTSALPHESSPRVTSLDADEGSMQQKLQELIELCTGLQREQTQMAYKIKAQDLEISGLKARVKFLEDKDRGRAKPSQEDAPIKGGSMEIGEEVRVERSTELKSNDTEEMVNVLSFMEASNILTSRVTAVSVSPVAAATTVGVPTVSGLFPTIDAQIAKEMKEDFARENQRLNEQIARDSEIAIPHAEEELKMMIEGLDRSNEVIAKHLQEYEQAAADLSVGEKIELISELVKYQDHHAKILKYQAKQSKPLSKKEQREFYMSEELKEMMQLVPLEEVYVEALQILVKETLSIKQAAKDKEKELWVELKRLFEPDFEDQLWTHNQNFMHDPLEWRLYDTCGVHHVFTKDQKIFMLVEKDYPLRKGLATMMICNKLQVEQYSQMANDLILKVHNISNSPR
uniref:Uncharacterized protein n=1 Tax=Tanacetum cinerariifolium TaxID=118510 RepID=A0A6L2KQN1_TANCI|nr:hypothetical protein [Tanacetum cinerariifolium]